MNCDLSLCGLGYHIRFLTNISHIGYPFDF